jgi:hypothetical protein
MDSLKLRIFAEIKKLFSFMESTLCELWYDRDTTALLKAFETLRARILSNFGDLNRVRLSIAAEPLMLKVKDFGISNCDGGIEDSTAVWFVKNLIEVLDKVLVKSSKFAAEMARQNR